jgi:hypothetical protein
MGTKKPPTFFYKNQRFYYIAIGVVKKTLRLHVSSENLSKDYLVPFLSTSF